jgi:hypothetical protein
MSQKRRQDEDANRKQRQRKPDKSWKRESYSESEIDSELEAMMLRINQQLRCRCGIIYSEHLKACTTCQAPNPIYVK